MSSTSFRFSVRAIIYAQVLVSVYFAGFGTAWLIEEKPVPAPAPSLADPICTRAIDPDVTFSARTFTEDVHQLVKGGDVSSALMLLVLSCPEELIELRGNSYYALEWIGFSPEEGSRLPGTESTFNPERDAVLPWSDMNFSHSATWDDYLREYVASYNRLVDKQIAEQGEKK